jgi:hypothetical protein
MAATVHGHARAQELAKALCDSPVRVDEWVLVEGREGRVVAVERTGLGSIAIRVAFSDDESKWFSPLHVRKLN